MTTRDWRRGALWGFGSSLLAVVISSTAGLWTDPPVTDYVALRALWSAGAATAIGLVCLVLALRTRR